MPPGRSAQAACWSHRRAVVAGSVTRVTSRDSSTTRGIGFISLLSSSRPVVAGELGASALRDPPPGSPRRALALRKAAAAVGGLPQGVPAWLVGVAAPEGEAPG